MKHRPNTFQVDSNPRALPFRNISTVVPKKGFDVTPGYVWPWRILENRPQCCLVFRHAQGFPAMEIIGTHAQ